MIPKTIMVNVSVIILLISCGILQDVFAGDKSEQSIIPDPVTGSFLDLNYLSSPMSFTTITQRDIHESGARNLTELLEIYVPGFQYMFNPYYGTLWGMRGISNDRNTKFIVLVNNHKLNMQSRDGFKSELVLGMLGDIERIEVLRGPASLVYGSGAIAGIVNIITRDDVKDTNVVSFSSGTVNGNTTDIFFTKKIADANVFRGSFGMRKSDGMDRFSTRLYGIPPWPFTSPFDKYDTMSHNFIIEDWEKNGVPTDGYHGLTPGNYKASADWDVAINDLEHLKSYVRFTRQVESVGGLFIYDPWPGHVGEPDMPDTVETSDGSYIIPGPGEGVVDGKIISPDNEFWKLTESYGDNRRQYVNDNLATFINYKRELSPQKYRNMHEFNVNMGFDKVSNVTTLEERLGYGSLSRAPDNVLETFGEWRLSPGITYFAKQGIPDKKYPEKQLALGIEYRLDGIGNDWSGKNEWSGRDKHKVVTDVIYHTFSCFGETFISRKSLRTDWTYNANIGGRLDLNRHSNCKWNTIVSSEDSGTETVAKNPLTAMWNYKVSFGAIAKPGNFEQAYKLILQTASNNGSADNYLPNRYHYNDDGNVNGFAVFEDTIKDPNPYQPIIQPYHDENLKPERIWSVELLLAHALNNRLFLNNSYSYGYVDNLFAWSQSNFRVKNAGKYEYFNWDVDLQWKGRNANFGINNTWQRPIQILSGNTSEVVYDSLYKDTVVNNVDIISKGYAICELDLRKNAITADSKNFLNLSTVVTKLYFSYKPVKWFAFHSDCRAFWGVNGRRYDESRQVRIRIDSANAESIFFAEKKVDETISTDFYSCDIANSWPPLLKLNVSLHFYLTSKVTFSLFAYNLLGIDNGRVNTDNLWDKFLQRNTIRPLYIADSKTSGLVSTDQQSFTAKMVVAF